MVVVVVNEGGGGGGLCNFWLPNQKFSKSKRSKYKFNRNWILLTKYTVSKPTVKIRWQSKFSTYIWQFYKRSFEWIWHLFASYPLYDKSFYIYGNHTKFGKTRLPKISNFVRCEKFCCFSRILRIKNFELRTGHWAFNSDIVNRQKRPISTFWVEDFLRYLNVGGKKWKSERVQKPRWASLEC